METTFSPGGKKLNGMIGAYRDIGSFFCARCNFVHPVDEVKIKMCKVSLFRLIALLTNKCIKGFNSYKFLLFKEIWITKKGDNLW